MSVDVVVSKFSDLATGHNIGGGALAWCTDDLVLAVQSALGGDWVVVGEAGRSWEGNPTYNGTIANGVSLDVSVTFPTGLFTQAPSVVANAFGSRLNVAIVAVTTTGCTVRLSNFSGANASDGTRALQVIAVQKY